MAVAACCCHGFGVRVTATLRPDLLLSLLVAVAAAAAVSVGRRPVARRPKHQRYCSSLSKIGGGSLEQGQVEARE